MFDPNFLLNVQTLLDDDFRDSAWLYDQYLKVDNIWQFFSNTMLPVSL